MANDEVPAKDLIFLVEALTARLGRLPTENEVINFIQGNDYTRRYIWNQNMIGGANDDDVSGKG